MITARHIFLSYRSTEGDFALRLAVDLKHSGINIWMDQLDGGIGMGDDWRRTIEDAVNTCVAMIAVLSPAYVMAKYCRRELARADDLDRPIFPILLRSIPDDNWPIEVQRAHYIDFRGWHDRLVYRQQLGVLLKHLRAHVALLGDTSPSETRELILNAERKPALDGVEPAMLTPAQDRVIPFSGEPFTAAITDDRQDRQAKRQPIGLSFVLRPRIHAACVHHNAIRRAGRQFCPRISCRPD